MSIHVSYQERYPEFADLLARYPKLAAWLADFLESQQDAFAEDLLPRFLAECIDLRISGDTFPFTAQDHGQAALQAYLQSARADIEAFVAKDTLLELSTPSREPVGSAETGDEQTQLASASDAASSRAEAGPATSETAEFASPGETSEEKNDATELESHEEVSEEKDDTVESTPHEETFEKKDEATEANADGTKDTSDQHAPKQRRMLFWRKTPGRRKGKHARRQRTRKQKIISWALLVLILAAILVPAGFLVNFGMNAYTTYHTLSDEAHRAVNQLLDLKKVFNGSSSHPDELFDSARLQRAQADFVASERDFQQLHDQLAHSPTLDTVTSYFPQYRATLASARAGSAIGIDISKIGQITLTNLIPLAPSFQQPLLASSGKALVTQPVLDTIGKIIDQVSPLLNDIQEQAANVSVNALPISASEKSQLEQLLPVLPQAIDDLNQARHLLGAIGWILGVGQPRTFLVQTMDRAELRAAGGFTGQYGELHVDGGRVAPFNLTDISNIEYVAGSATQGQVAPEQYRSWWPFANWGLRDSNVSADFPTTARLALSLYQQETGHQLDGVISFTPIVIEHVLAVIGPIYVPDYDETITAQNLEDRLHYYQLDNGGIYKQYLVNLANGGNANTSARKQFTNLLTTLLLNKVRSEPPAVLLAVAHQVLQDLQTKDLQVYFTDPTAEQALMQYGYAAQMDRSTTHDGLFVVQENLSASKASQYVQTTLHDAVTLDSQGGATHHLQINLAYHQAGQVYGYDTYYDYLRVYVPTGSQLLSGNGFSSGIPLCGGRYGSCPVDGPYPNGELTCPAGQYQPGAMPPTLSDPSGTDWQSLQTLGEPTNTTSDEPGRAMYGGWVIIPKNCTLNVTLSWYVPPMSQHGYSLLVQRQAGTFPELDVSILSDAANCAQLRTAGMHVDTILTEDTIFSPPTIKSAQPGCRPNVGG